MRRSALIVAPLLALVLVAGCGQGDDNDAADGSGTSDSDSKSGDKDSDSGGDGSLKSCVVGDWEADTDAMEALGMDTSVFDDLGSDMSLDFVFTFAKGGDFDWNLDLSGTDETEGTPVTVEANFNFIGTWKVSGSDAVDLTLEDANGSMTYSADGQDLTQDMDADDLGVGETSTVTMTTTCSGSTLKMTNDASNTLTLKR
ncbi:MAG: hypothetical protein LBU50_07545 [Cellulomonas sp.]|jgi:hypothetical protein|nr:hypothetical protein [Cellulomonas sp.]